MGHADQPPQVQLSRQTLTWGLEQVQAAPSSEVPGAQTPSPVHAPNAPHVHSALQTRVEVPHFPQGCDSVVPGAHSMTPAGQVAEPLEVDIELDVLPPDPDVVLPFMPPEPELAPAPELELEPPPEPEPAGASL